jgi:hypothetical protein
LGRRRPRQARHPPAGARRGRLEEVLTLDSDDADNLQDLLEDTDTVHYYVERQVLMFGVAKVGD